MTDDDDLDIQSQPWNVHRRPDMATQTKTTTKERVPGPEPEPVTEAPPAQLPATTSNGQGRPVPLASDNEGNRPIAAFPVTGVGKIATAIADIMSELEPVVKTGKVEAGSFGYKYDRMQDIIEQLSKLMGSHGLVVVPTMVGKPTWVGEKHVTVNYAFTIVHKSGEVWPERPIWPGLSVATSNRGGFDDKCLNKCSTQAAKFFYKRLFNIPTEDDDDESERQRREPVAGPSGKPPHEVEPLRGQNAAQWTARFLAEVRQSKSTDEVDKWERANDGWIAKLEADEVEQHKKVTETLTALRNELGARAEPEPETKKPTRSAGNVTHPDPIHESETFLAWLDAQCARFKDAELMQQWWNQRIDKLIEGMFPTDQDTAMAIYDKHERRLEVQ